jgi:hypothetical protein
MTVRRNDRLKVSAGSALPRLAGTPGSAPALPARLPPCLRLVCRDDADRLAIGLVRRVMCGFSQADAMALDGLCLYAEGCCGTDKAALVTGAALCFVRALRGDRCGDFIYMDPDCPTASADEIDLLRFLGIVETGDRSAIETEACHLARQDEPRFLIEKAAQLMGVVRSATRAAECAGFCPSTPTRH